MEIERQNCVIEFPARLILKLQGSWSCQYSPLNCDQHPGRVKTISVAVTDECRE
jgi:hypothetical protein